MDSRSREKSAADTQVEASSEIFSEIPYMLHLLLTLTPMHRVAFVAKLFVALLSGG